MCGIAGVFNYRSGGRSDRELVHRMADVQAHRGPDDSGVWADGPVALGHRRLSIIDASAAGHQPMPNPDESLWVTYNGELYGWPAMRAELAARGHRFRGTSDTEGLLHLYEELGDGFLERLRGMFAFALYDRRRRRLVLARDRLGIKPLFYHDDGRRLLFASELKALLQDPSVGREVDHRSMADYLTYQYVPSPGSILSGVRKVPAGHYLVVDQAGVTVHRYWSLPVQRGETRDRGGDYYRDRLRELLEEAVRLRMVADVPLGAFLSGGIDSSAVVALMRRVSTGNIRTFSVGFNDAQHDELVHARRVAEHLGTEHTELVVRPNALELLPRLVAQLDEPFADPSMIPTYYVSEAARQHVTVALSGDGGDETFAGYVTYAWARKYHLLDVVPYALRRMLGRPSRTSHRGNVLTRRLRRAGMSVVDRHLDAMTYFDRIGLDQILSAECRAELRGYDPLASARRHYQRAQPLGELAALLHLDASTYMVDDVLTKVDRTSMLTSLEVRVPLLDHRLQEFAATIPFRYKLRGDVSKWVLRESVRDLLPAEILARGKQGFGVPLQAWLGAGFGRLARELLLDGRARRRGWFDAAAVGRLLAGDGVRAEDGVRQVWAMMCLELWAQTYLDQRGNNSSTAPSATGPTQGYVRSS